MPKRVIWKQMIVHGHKVASTLTVHNFQPGKFALTDIGNGNVLIVYVEKEIPNVE